MYGIIILCSCLSLVMMEKPSTDVDQRLQTACGFTGNWFSAKSKTLGKISAQSQTYYARMFHLYSY